MSFSVTVFDSFSNFLGLEQDGYIELTYDNTNSTTATFAWSRAAVTGISNLAGSGNTAAITETLINTTVEPVDVVYVVTPSVDGCAGTPFNVTAKVNPTSVITSNATAPNRCNNTSTTYTATSSSTTATFAWSRAAVTGISNLTGSGNTAAITETLINTTVEPIDIVYVVTPSVDGCAGTPFNVTAKVNPTSVITSDATAPNRCNNTSTTYTATSSSTTATFAWSRAAVTGISNLAGSGNTAAITETLVNGTVEPIDVVYVVTPSVDGCAGTPFNVTAKVNPTAVITSNATANWCNNVSNTYTATSSSTTATFAWTRASVTGITPATGSGATATITETLENSTVEPINVLYVVTPSVDGCAGTPYNVTVTVNPTSVITSNATAPNRCNNTSTTYTATSSSTTATFAWTRASVTGITPATGSGATSAITETLVNGTVEPIDVVYVVTPSVNGCAGTPFNVTAKVNPTAVITSNATAPNRCNNTSTTYTATSSSTTATFAWSRAAVTGISNLAGAVTGRVFDEKVKEGPTNLFYADVVRGNQPKRRSAVTFTGGDPMGGAEALYTQSEQRGARYFQPGEEDFVLLTEHPDCDLAWFRGLTPEQVRSLDQTETLVPLERRIYRWHCGCNQQRMMEVLAPTMKQDPAELFGDDPKLEIRCPRCGARHVVTREAMEAWVAARGA